MQKAKNIPFHSRPLSGSLLVRYSWLMYVMLLLCKLLGLNFTDGSEHVLYRRLHVVRKARRIGQMADMRSIFCIFALHCDNVGCLCHAVLNIGTVPPWDCPQTEDNNVENSRFSPDRIIISERSMDAETSGMQFTPKPTK